MMGVEVTVLASVFRPDSRDDNLGEKDCRSRFISGSFRLEPDDSFGDWAPMVAFSNRL